MSCLLLFSMFLILPDSFSVNGENKYHTGGKEQTNKQTKQKIDSLRLHVATVLPSQWC